jgi:cyclophilin family peptidyl-prolyl cis-trans isomerase
MRARWLLLLALALVVVAAGCGSSSKKKAAAPPTPTFSTPTTTASPTTTTTGSETAPTNVGSDGCDHAVPPAAKGKVKHQYKKPGKVLEKGHLYEIVMVTSCGKLLIKLDPARGGPIPNSVAFLTVKHFYDGLTFHRVVPGFVLQGGDPNGDGSGGSGYEVVGPVPAGYTYRLGDVAMAKTGSDPSGAAGSQFFVISGTQGEALPTDYGLAGHAGDSTSLQTISRIGALGVSDGPPSSPVYIWSARLKRIS